MNDEFKTNIFTIYMQFRFDLKKWRKDVAQKDMNEIKDGFFPSFFLLNRMEIGCEKQVGTF